MRLEESCAVNRSSNSSAAAVVCSSVFGAVAVQLLAAVIMCCCTRVAGRVPCSAVCCEPPFSERCINLGDMSVWGSSVVIYVEVQKTRRPPQYK